MKWEGAVGMQAGESRGRQPAGAPPIGMGGAGSWEASWKEWQGSPCPWACMGAGADTKTKCQEGALRAGAHARCGRANTLGGSISGRLGATMKCNEFRGSGTEEQRAACSERCEAQGPKLLGAAAQAEALGRSCSCQL